MKYWDEVAKKITDTKKAEHKAVEPSTEPSTEPKKVTPTKKKVANGK